MPKKASVPNHEQPVPEVQQACLMLNRLEDDVDTLPQCFIEHVMHNPIVWSHVDCMMGPLKNRVLKNEIIQLRKNSGFYTLPEHKSLS